jgi:hypothetical protein
MKILKIEKVFVGPKIYIPKFESKHKSCVVTAGPTR